MALPTLSKHSLQCYHDKTHCYQPCYKNPILLLHLRDPLGLLCVPGFPNTVLTVCPYLYTLAISPSLGGSRHHKVITKTMGVSLRSSNNDKGPGRVWMMLLEQHSPSSLVFHNSCRCHLPCCPYHRVASLRQPCGKSRCQSELRHNRSCS